MQLNVSLLLYMCPSFQWATEGPANSCATPFGSLISHCTSLNMQASVKHVCKKVAEVGTSDSTQCIRSTLAYFCSCSPSTTYIETSTLQRAGNSHGDGMQQGVHIPPKNLLLSNLAGTKPFIGKGQNALTSCGQY